MSCTCNANPAGDEQPTELEQVVAEVIQASATGLDEKFADVFARLDAIDAAIAPVDPDADPDDPITASPEDTADSRVRELENRIAQIEEALSAIIVESTPEMAGMS